MDKLKWYFFPKDFLPEALLYANRPEDAGGKEVIRPGMSMDELILGYPVDNNESVCGSPSLVILPDYKPAEVLAWLRIYAPETSPLSQFARVISQKDFNSYEHKIPFVEKNKEYLERWASVILGEVLAQGEVDVSLGLLPLSRAQASFSNAVARASICYKSSYWVGKCVID